MLKIKIMRMKKIKNNAIRAITCLGQIFIARRRVREMRVYARRLSDLHDYLVFRHSRHTSLSTDASTKYSMIEHVPSINCMVTMRKLVKRRFLA